VSRNGVLELNLWSGGSQHKPFGNLVEYDANLNEYDPDFETLKYAEIAVCSKCEMKLKLT
jgi:hypothetical protein